MKEEPQEIEIYYPPPEGSTGKSELLACCGMEDTSEGGCGFEKDISVSRESPSGEVLGKCPECGGGLRMQWSGRTFGIKMKGPGFHSTKVGQKRKRELTARNERLASTQWENHEPAPLDEGVIPRNPTPGGPHDPNGPMYKGKKKPKIYIPK